MRIVIAKKLPLNREMDVLKELLLNMEMEVAKELPLNMGMEVAKELSLIIEVEVTSHNSKQQAVFIINYCWQQDVLISMLLRMEGCA